MDILAQVPTRLLFLTVEFRLLTILLKMLTVVTMLMLPIMVFPPMDLDL